MVVIRAVVFDIGGVLEVTPRFGLLDRWEAKFGLPPGRLVAQTEHIWRDGSVGAISLRQVHEGLAGATGLAEATVDALMADMWTQYLGTLNVELAGFFRGLRPRYRTAILSNSFVGAREKERERYGLEELTDFIVYSHEVGMSKPDPRIYRLTWRRLGVSPEEMVFLDDAAPLVEAARECGIHAIRYENNAQAIADVEALLPS